MAPLKAANQALAAVIPFASSPVHGVDEPELQAKHYKSTLALDSAPHLVPELRRNILKDSNPFVVTVVDDEPHVLALIQDYLDAMECKVVAFQDSRKAVQYLRSFKVDAVLLDRRMPELDGFALAQIVRASQVNRAVPIGMLSGVADVESMQESFHCGITAFLGKPVCWDRLARMVNILRVAAQAHPGKRMRAVTYTPIPLLRDIHVDQPLHVF